MPISNEQKAEKAYKKVVLGVAMTANNKSYYTEPISPTSVRDPKNVWLDAADIPVTAPVTPVASTIYDKNGVDVVTSGLPGVIQYIDTVMTAVQGSNDSFMLTNEHATIAFNSINGQYAPQFIDNSTGDPIPFGLNAMEYDIDAGVLFFVEGKPAGLTAVRIKYWRYVGRTFSDVIPVLGNSSFTSEDLLTTNGKLVFIGNDVTFTHNLNTDKIFWKFKKGNEVIFPSTIIENSNNVATFTFIPAIADVDNVKVELIVFT